MSTVIDASASYSIVAQMLRQALRGGKTVGLPRFRYNKTSFEFVLVIDVVQIAARAEEVEANLRLAGVTAIEDKLQDGVPSTIQTLLAANIKVCTLSPTLEHTHPGAPSHLLTRIAPRRRALHLSDTNIKVCTFSPTLEHLSPIDPPSSKIVFFPQIRHSSPQTSRCLPLVAYPAATFTQKPSHLRSQICSTLSNCLHS